MTRYFQHVLPEQPPSRIRVMRMTQRGSLRTHPRHRRWLAFRADHVAHPRARSFAWDATVGLLPLVRVHVRDAYAEGIGSGQVQLLSAWTVASDSNTPELNSASLHRYLAEAVWYPSALLPAAGVQWSAIDDSTALATLDDRGNRAALEFRFNDAAEVVGVYARERWMRTASGYERRPWEGRFGTYRRHQGVLVPRSGEVGWHVEGRLEIVWRGEIASLAYEFEQV